MRRAASSYPSVPVTNGMCASRRPRMIETRCSTGIVMKLSQNAIASPRVTGYPRAIRTTAGSRGEPGGAFAASTSPMTTGSAVASMTQTARTIHVGTRSGTGTNASARAAMRGANTPITRSGQSAAEATSPVRRSCSAPDVTPNSARTAHPKIALRTFPADRPMNASNA